MRRPNGDARPLPPSLRTFTGGSAEAVVTSFTRRVSDSRLISCAQLDPLAVAVEQYRLDVGSIARMWCLAIEKSRGMSPTPPSAFTPKRTPFCEFFPDLVVIAMTPAPARSPYRFEAAAPLSTSTLSISFGLTSWIPPLMNRPSTM